VFKLSWAIAVALRNTHMYETAALPIQALKSTLMGMQMCRKCDAAGLVCRMLALMASVDLLCWTILWQHGNR